MQVKRKLINTWRRLKDKGDVAAIAEITNMNAATISRVINGKQETSSDLIMKISEFYAKKKARLRESEDDLN